MHRMVWATVIVLVVTGCSSPSPALQGTVIDLTHHFDEQTVYWPTASGFEFEPGFTGVTERGFYYAAHGFRTAEHGGTHIDAPIHFHADRWTVDQIPVERLIGPGVVIDVTASCMANPDFLLGVPDLEAWEARHGRLPDGAIVLIRTGFGRYWPDRERYMGTAERGEAAVAKLHFPGLDPAAAAWIAEQRSIDAIGIDTPSIDHGPTRDFESHVRLFESAIPVLENVAHLDILPAKGFTVIALPMKIRGGSGGPTRIVAVLDP